MTPPDSKAWIGYWQDVPASVRDVGVHDQTHRALWLRADSTYIEIEPGWSFSFGTWSADRSTLVLRETKRVTGTGGGVIVDPAPRDRRPTKKKTGGYEFSEETLLGVECVVHSPRSDAPRRRSVARCDSADHDCMQVDGAKLYRMPKAAEIPEAFYLRGCRSA